MIIHGGSGGVGTLAIQFAKLRGAWVLATASEEDGQALVRKLGADAAVDGHHGDIACASRSFAPNGIDAILAFAGGDSRSNTKNRQLGTATQLQCNSASTMLITPCLATRSTRCRRCLFHRQPRLAGKPADLLQPVPDIDSHRHYSKFVRECGVYRCSVNRAL